MLSYMLPVEEKSSQTRNLNLDLNLNNGNHLINNTTTNHTRFDNENNNNIKLINSERTSTITANNNMSGVLKNNFQNQNKQKQFQNLIKNDQNLNNFNTTSILSNSNSGGTIGSNGSNGGIIGFNSGNNSIDDNNSKKIKMSKIGGTTKNVTLKRVSFGSSKGSMVETLVFETPTPLPEHAEREFGFSVDPTNKIYNNNLNSYLDDSGIEMQEELERSKVRVTFFQSGKPQQISPPENHIQFFDTDNNSYTNHLVILDPDQTINNNMTTTTGVTAPIYDRQMSTESGWDNPFRPGGDLSREADEIVSMIKGGKPITPTGDEQHIISNGTAQQLNHIIENGQSVVDAAVKTEISQVQSSINGTKSPQKNSIANNKNGEVVSQQQQPPTQSTSQTQVSNQVIPGPQSARHVVLDDEKKKKKCTCCVIQ